MSATSPPGWLPFGSHASYSEDFGEPCPPLIFSEETGEDGLPLWERIDPAAIRRATAEWFAEEIRNRLEGGHNDCVSQAMSFLEPFLRTPIYPV